MLIILTLVFIFELQHERPWIIAHLGVGPCFNYRLPYSSLSALYLSLFSARRIKAYIMEMDPSLVSELQMSVSAQNTS